MSKKARSIKKEPKEQKGNDSDFAALMGGEIDPENINIDDDMEELMAEMGVGKGKVTKGKGAPSNKSDVKQPPPKDKKNIGKKDDKAKPEITPEEALALLNDARNLAVGDIDIDDTNLDDIELSDGDLDCLNMTGLDASDFIDKSKPKSPKSGVAVAAVAAEDDDDEDDDVNVDDAGDDDVDVDQTEKKIKKVVENKKPSAVSKPNLRTKREIPPPPPDKKTTKLTSKGVIQPPPQPKHPENYEQAFNYFSACFYNLCLHSSNAELYDEFKTRIDKLVPVLFNSPEDKVDVSHIEIFGDTNPSLPCGKYQRIKTKQLQKTKYFKDMNDCSNILTKQENHLKEMKKTAGVEHDEKTVELLNKAIKETKQSLTMLLKPKFLVKDLLLIPKSNQNMSLAENEILVTFISVENVKVLGSKYSIELPGIGSFTSPTINSTNQELNSQITKSNYNQKAAIERFKTNGKLTYIKNNTTFSLLDLYPSNTAKITVSFEGTSLIFSVGIRTPLDGADVKFQKEEILLSPCVIASRPKVSANAIRVKHQVNIQVDKQVRQTTNDAELKPKKTIQSPSRPAAATTNKVALPPKQTSTMPEYSLLSIEDGKLFWGTKVTDFYINKTKALINMYSLRKLEIPPQVTQLNEIFIARMKEFEEAQENGTMDPAKYLQDLEDAVKREEGILPTIKNKLTFDDRSGMCGLLTQERDEIKAYLDGGGGEEE